MWPWILRNYVSVLFKKWLRGQEAGRSLTIVNSKREYCQCLFLVLSVNKRPPSLCFSFNANNRIVILASQSIQCSFLFEHSCSISSHFYSLRIKYSISDPFILLYRLFDLIFFLGGMISWSLLPLLIRQKEGSICKCSKIIGDDHLQEEKNTPGKSQKREGKVACIHRVSTKY